MITLCAIYKSTFASLARLETLKGDQEPNIHSINKRWQYLLMHLCIFWGLIWSTCVSFGGWSEAPLCLLGADLKHLCVFWGFIWSIFVSFGGGLLIWSITQCLRGEECQHSSAGEENVWKSLSCENMYGAYRKRVKMRRQKLWDVYTFI